MTTPSLPDAGGYRYDSAGLNCSHGYLLPALLEILRRESATLPKPVRVFDLGCGNGAVAHAVAGCGYQVRGVDPSGEGIAQARRAYPDLVLEAGSAYDCLTEKFGRFPVVYSLEVVEHVYYPRKFAACLFDLVQPGGIAIVSTPYHGYIKNLALALTGKMDDHFTALWDHGHVKFWSRRTLGELLRGAGFTEIRFPRLGRVPALARAMIAAARRPFAGVRLAAPGAR